MNSYKKGEDTATVVVLLLLILGVVWLWKSNTGSVVHEEKIANKANVSSISVRMDRQTTVMNDQSHAVIIKDSQLTK